MFLPLIGQSPEKTAQLIYNIVTDEQYLQGEFRETNCGSLGPDGKSVQLCKAIQEHPEWSELVWNYVDKVTNENS